jgi:hypothetical protein
MIQPLNKPTHYSYLGGPDGIREPTAIYNLDDISVPDRRRLVGRLIARGELLAVVPDVCPVATLADLRNCLIWLRNRGK